MLRFLLIPLASLCAYADSIAVEISPERHVVVREHYSVNGPTEFVFLASSCGRIDEIQLAGGRRIEAGGSGPWITVSIPLTTAVDLSYIVAPVIASPRTCAVPILMPKRSVGSVSFILTDLGSGLSRIPVPQLLAHPESKTWTATFPAVPSQLQLEWENGNASPPSNGGPVGRFEWNFWGLTGILVTWTIAYLLWARRPAA